MSIEITYIIGTNDVGTIAGAEDYRAEVEQRLREAFQEAQHVDAVIDDGRSIVRVEGLDWQTDGELVDAIMAEVWRIADEVWGCGSWRNATRSPSTED